MYCCTYASAMGQLLLVSDGQALTELRFAPEAEQTEPRLPVLCAACQWLNSYFQGKPCEITFPVKPDGTPFQRQVWVLLEQIPFGETRTYGSIAGEVAAIMGKEKMSAQAVGQAVGRNPIPIVIPCHRVIGAGGMLTGYAGGLDRKQWLLRHEGAVI